MNDQQREALRAAMERIAEFNEQCEAEQHTDTGEAWTILGEAHDAIEALFTPIKPEGPFWGCLECGCTDIEHESWVETNTGKVTDDCGSYVWCPQCQTSDSRSIQVDALKPYCEHDPITYTKHPSGDIATKCRKCYEPMENAT